MSHLRRGLGGVARAQLLVLQQRPPGDACGGGGVQLLDLPLQETARPHEALLAASLGRHLPPRPPSDIIENEIK
eukprot:7368312-Pyramimonas_sp.AAC.1